MVCWAKKTREKPFDIKVNFNDALGPTILGTFQQIKNTLENVGTQREEYGKQRSLPDNEELINQAE